MDFSVDFSQDMAGNTAAFEQTVRSTIELVAGLSDADWDLPTDCPGWTVKDQVSHIIGIERGLAGLPDAPHEIPADLPYLRNDFGRALEVAVDLRRPVPGPEVLAELREVLDARLKQLPGIDPEQETFNPDGRTGTYARLMMFRAFDCWIHEQDVRRAVGRPGNAAAPAGDRAWQIMSGGLGFVVGKRAGAAPGQSVAFRTTGAAVRTAVLEVGADGRAATADVESPTTTLTLDWLDFVRLAGGRRTPRDVIVTIDGDHALARRVLDNLAITP